MQGLKPMVRAFLMDVAEVADCVRDARGRTDGNAFLLPARDLEEILRSFVKHAQDRPTR